MNELMWVITLILSFSSIVIFYKLYGKIGLFVWLGLATIISNIQTVKLVNIFGFETALGTILYSTTSLATDIINEKYGRKNAKKAISIGFASMIAMTVLMSLSLLYKPSASDFSNESLKLIFTLNIRITIASVLAYLTSQFCDVWLFEQFKKRFKSLWIRSKGSTIFSQLIDTIIFVAIAYYGQIPFDILIKIGITTYVFKFVIAILDTPFLYLANKLKPKEI